MLRFGAGLVEVPPLGAPLLRKARYTIRKPTEPITRFQAMVDDAGDCWLWKGQIMHGGYGRFRVGSTLDGTRRKVSAHRWAYEHFIGPIPEGHQVHHLCGDRACVKPAHLWACPPEDHNHLHTPHRGGSPGRRRPATHCRYGHELTAANTYLSPSGSRQCRECRRRGRRDWAARHKATHA